MISVIMKNRVTNTDSYIFSAITYIGRKNFTSNDLAKILIERFYLQKTLFKAKAFAYNQLQVLVKRGLLTKTRQKGLYQHLYSETPNFRTAIIDVELLDAAPYLMTDYITSDESKVDKNINNTLKCLINKYTNELEKISGAKEVYDELCLEVPNREKEFKMLSFEQERKSIRINEKINILIKIIDNSCVGI